MLSSERSETGAFSSALPTRFAHTIVLVFQVFCDPPNTGSEPRNVSTPEADDPRIQPEAHPRVPSRFPSS